MPELIGRIKRYVNEKRTTLWSYSLSAQTGDPSPGFFRTAHQMPLKKGGFFGHIFLLPNPSSFCYSHFILFQLFNG